MHSFETNSSKVPAFLVKLWKLVEDPNCDDLIAWSDSGDSFVIKDQAKFAKELLPRYFKHNNITSFIRQANLYGFKNVTNYEKNGLQKENNGMEFQNVFFIKERSELLELIKRRISNPKVPDPLAKTNAKDILIDLTSIREKQGNMDCMLLKMKQENQLLWRELTTMRQKHKAQEQIIQKVVQFLMPILQKSENQNMGAGVQRKINRIHDIPETSSSEVSRTIDVLRNKNSECIVVPEQIVSPLGPVIHEVTDNDHDETVNISVAKSPDVVHLAESPASKNISDGMAIPGHPKLPGISKSTSAASTAKQPGIFEDLQERNALTNHLLSVDEILNYAVDQLASSPWNFDKQNLLELFSTDGLVNCDSLSSNLLGDTCIKTETNNITGNETVQFTPNMQEKEMDLENSLLFEALNQDAEVPSSDFNYQLESLPDVLKETSTSAAPNFLTNEASTDNTSQKRKKGSTKTNKHHKAM